MLNSLKKRLETAKERCPEELSEVLWTYSTTIKSSTRESPFAYVLILEESSLRFAHTIEDSNNEAVATTLDIVEGQREMALI